jgi:hypothetical protein
MRIISIIVIQTFCWVQFSWAYFGFDLPKSISNTIETQLPQLTVASDEENSETTSTKLFDSLPEIEYVPELNVTVVTYESPSSDFYSKSVYIGDMRASVATAEMLVKSLISTTTIIKDTETNQVILNHVDNMLENGKAHVYIFKGNDESHNSTYENLKNYLQNNNRINLEAILENAPVSPEPGGYTLWKEGDKFYLQKNREENQGDLTESKPIELAKLQIVKALNDPVLAGVLGGLKILKPGTLNCGIFFSILSLTDFAAAITATSVAAAATGLIGGILTGIVVILNEILYKQAQKYTIWNPVNGEVKNLKNISFGSFDPAELRDFLNEGSENLNPYLTYLTVKTIDDVLERNKSFKSNNLPTKLIIRNDWEVFDFGRALNYIVHYTEDKYDIQNLSNDVDFSKIEEEIQNELQFIITSALEIDTTQVNSVIEAFADNVFHLLSEHS